MKLKYYMRGLGIGIIFATLLLIISNPKEKLTDKEIMERASELGMVKKEENDLNLDEILGEAETTGTPTIQPSITPEPEVQPTAEPTQTPTDEAEVEPTVEPTPEPTVAPTPTDKPVVEEQEGQGIITFTIKSGMSSGKVAAMLVEIGLITDADEFNQYIVKAGKASIIRVGTYSVPQGATYEEIMLKITTR